MDSRRVKYLVRKAEERDMDAKAFLVWLEKNRRDRRETRYTPNWTEALDGFHSNFEFAADTYDDELDDDTRIRQLYRTPY